MKILIKVTKDVLRRSMMCGLNPTHDIGSSCAIALAIRDLFPMAYIGRYQIFFSDPFTLGNGLPTIELPQNARKFIGNFDDLKNDPEKRLLMTPISFEISIPNEVIEEINISTIYKVLSESHTLELVHP